MMQAVGRVSSVAARPSVSVAQAWAARGLPPGLSWRPDHVMRRGRVLPGMLRWVRRVARVDMPTSARSARLQLAGFLPLAVGNKHLDMILSTGVLVHFLFASLVSGGHLGIVSMIRVWMNRNGT